MEESASGPIDRSHPDLVQREEIGFHGLRVVGIGSEEARPTAADPDHVVALILDAVALGLLSAGGAQTERSAQRLRPMLTAFLIGAAGTVLGSLLAFRLCHPMLLARPAAANAASLMCATYVGGSANFFAVATATRAAARHPGLLPSLLAADLALMGVYLLVLTAAARAPSLRTAFPAVANDGDETESARGIATPSSSTA